MNNTRIDTKHVNLRLMRQRIELDQVYAAKIVHIPGVDTPGADGLSRMETLDEILPKLMQEVFTIDGDLTHVRELNPDFPLGLLLIKSEQDKWNELQRTRVPIRQNAIWRRGSHHIQ
jgi:hypothetical protein